MDAAEIFGTVVAVLIIAIIITLVVTFPTMLLWNWIMAGVFGLPTLTFWQTWGLTTLCGILFKDISIKKGE